MTERDRIYFEMITIAYPLGAEYQELSGIRRLADADYRKADEVRKETAKDILKKVGGIVDDFDDRFHIRDYQWFKDICKEFSVEVDE